MDNEGGTYWRPIGSSVMGPPRPNLTPREIFKLGSFGGTYWRPIDSAVTGESYAGMHKKYPADWWEGIPARTHLTRPWAEYDKGVNYYGVRVGSTLEQWEGKGWITEHDPYGWVQWYCEWENGRERPAEDERQMGRWLKLAGPKGRFRRALITRILRAGAAWDDEDVSPKTRQTLQHWGYRLTEEDFEADLDRRRGDPKKRDEVRAWEDARLGR